jgi:hypothetical protein
MLEVPHCIHCSKPIYVNSDHYLVTNKDTAKSRNDWLYAHALCQELPDSPAQVLRLTAEKTQLTR